MKAACTPFTAGHLLGMKIFLDTANIEEIKNAAPLGVVDGITTNPSLIAKEGVPVEEQIRRVCDVFEGDVSAAVVATSASEMIQEGRRLARISTSIVVKLPLTRDGIAATSALTREGTRVNVTLCFSASQALLAAKAGAYIVSPFVGRVDDLGWPGIQLIGEIAEIYQKHNFETQILAASLRGPRHVVEVAKAGAHISTLAPRVLDQLFFHPLTERGIDQFLSEYNRVFEMANTR